MKFNDKTDVLLEDLSSASKVISGHLKAPPNIINRMMVQGCFHLIAHCKEEHGLDLPVNVDEMLLSMIGQAGLDAAKQYCEDNGEESLVNVLASPVEVGQGQA